MTIEINATGASATSETSIDAAWANAIATMNQPFTKSADEPVAADRPDGAVGEAQVDAMWAAAVKDANGGQGDG